MAVVRRGGKLYVYLSVWRDGRVTSRYVGAGEAIAEVDRLGAQLRLADRERAAEAAEEERELRRAARERAALARAAHRAEVERDARIEAALQECGEAVARVLAAAMAARGYRRRRGEWRRRRGAMTAKTELAGPGASAVPAVPPDLPDLLARTAAAMAEREGTTPGEMAGRIAALAAQVAGPGATPLERLLAERVAVCLIDADRCDAEGNWPSFLGPGDLEPGRMAETALRLARLGPEHLHAEIERADRARGRSYRRLGQAVKALADARRRPAVLAVSLNLPAGPADPEAARVVVVE